MIGYAISKLQSYAPPREDYSPNVSITNDFSATNSAYNRMQQLREEEMLMDQKISEQRLQDLIYQNTISGQKVNDLNSMLRYRKGDEFDPYFNPNDRSAMARTPWGRAMLKQQNDARNQYINSKLTAMSVPLPQWMQKNAQRDVAAGFDPVSAYTNASAGGLVNPITGRAADGLRENASLTNYLNRSNAAYTQMNGGIGYDQLMGAFRKAIGLSGGGIGSGGRPL